MTVSSDPSISLRVILSPSKDEQQAVGSKKSQGRKSMSKKSLLPCSRYFVLGLPVGRSTGEFVSWVRETLVP